MRSVRRGTAGTGALLLVVLTALSPRLQGADIPVSSECVIVDIHRIGNERLDRIIDRPGIDAWLELDDELFVCAGSATLPEIEKLATVERQLGRLDSSRLRLAYRQSRPQLEEAGSRVLASGGLFALVEVPREGQAGVLEPEGALPFRSGLVLARQVANETVSVREARLSAESTVGRLVAGVDTGRWLADVEGLATFNRYSLGSGIGQARKWLVSRFREIPGLRVRSRFFAVESALVANVIATLPGASRPDHVFIVGAHYDSTSEAPETAAPGAEDNASGCAGVLEMARVFAADPPEATVVFVCYAGEEQGLFGGEAHAAELVLEGDASKVGAMLNLDMIAFTEDDDLDCLLQSSEEWRFLVDVLLDSAARHTGLRMVTSFVLGGSDHVPYAVSGMPAVLSIENDWDTYPHYHRTTDTPDKLTRDMAGEILRMNVGALARLAGAADVTGCLELDDAPFGDRKVVAVQPGEFRQSSRTDRQGCFAVDPLTRGKRFRLKVKGSVPGDPSRLDACVRLLGEPLADRTVVLRQSGSAGRTARTGEDGCFAFDTIANARFTLVLKGPAVSED